MTAVLLAIGGEYWYAGRERPTPTPVLSPPPTLLAAPVQVSKPKPPPVDLDAVYRSSMAPLLDKFDQRNATAVARALQTLDDRMRVHRAGVKPFVRDITSWRTRFGVMGRYTKDVWYHTVRRRPSATVNVYVNNKFREHVMSEQSLRQDVDVVLAQFDRDMAASRNELYAQMTLELGKIKVAYPETAPNFDRFRQSVDRDATTIARSAASDTLVAGLVSVAGGWVATDVGQVIATRVVTQILTQLGTNMAVEGIEAGGATLSGSAAGGGAGSLAGPAGTVIGIGVGLVIGAGVDWWLTDRFQSKVSQQCNRFLDVVQYRLRDGSPAAPGLQPALQRAVAETSRIQRSAVLKAMKESPL